MGKALALMYHDVVAEGGFALSGFSTVGADHYKLTQEQFAAHLSAIDSTISNKPVLISDDSWQRSFLFTMDDGGSSSRYVADQLERHGWRGHFFIVTDCIGRREFLNAGELRELAKRGHSIGSHTCSHPIPMWNCTPEQMSTEWNASRQKLESILGEAVTCGSVPGGSYALPVAAAAAKAGYLNLFSSEPTWAVHYVEGCRVLGRFGILRTTTPTEAAKLANGDLFACSRQQALWNAKKVLKKVAAKPYAVARGFIMQRRYTETAELASSAIAETRSEAATEVSPSQPTSKD